jgi:hypothetical protein
MAKNVPLDPLSYPIHQYPIVFIDYLWVITIYILISFSMAVIIDGYILPPFNEKKESTYSSAYLIMIVLAQLAVQGFIAILLCALLQKIPSPVNHLYGYDYKSSLGALIRNPAIISAVLLTLSASLRARLLYLFSRFDKNVTQDK